MVGVKPPEPPDASTTKENIGSVMAGHARWRKAEERKALILTTLRTKPAMRVKELAAVAGVTVSTYEKYRQRDREWAMQIDAARRSEIADGKTLARSFAGGFAHFRRQYFGFDSPWFHLEVVDALENGKPGSITMILLPPEHGKSTLLTDYCCYKLALEPDFRISYGSGKQGQAIKVGNRIRERMDPDGPSMRYVRDFGPMAPSPGRVGQPWSRTFFSVNKKRAFDDQEYSWQALGMTGSVAGTRSDLLIVDDMQELASLGQTEKIVATFRQDWLSRPGAKGRTVIIGTRVGDGDVYETLEDEVRPDGTPLISRIVRYPAVRRHFDTGEPVYLWPERYSIEEYTILEGNVGPAAWARNYQQKPNDKRLESFDEETLGFASDQLHSWQSDIPLDVRELAITLDPALGGCNAFQVQGWAPTRMVVLDGSRQWGLTNFGQIYNELENLLAHWSTRRREDGIAVPITEVVIEDKAFQKGLPNDDRIKELQAKYGFAIVPHQTGHNKNDEVLGVTAMVLSMRRREIVIPSATDSTTLERIGPLFKDLRKWRPRIRGNRLKQDEVMATWFGWLRWRSRRHTLAEPTEQAPAAAAGSVLPWAPMKPVFLTGHGPGSPLRVIKGGRASTGARR